MAKRICFISTPSEYPIYKEIEVEFEYFNGFAVSQKQKSIRSMHESVNKMDKSLQILEVSTKSTNPTGVALSAFNLKFYEINTDMEYPLENIFQSSKVFERGGPYRDLLNVHPKDAKRDERLKSSGNLIHFNYKAQSGKESLKQCFMIGFILVLYIEMKVCLKRYSNLMHLQILNSIKKNRLTVRQGQQQYL